jgi:hypothetical protein
MKFVRPQRVGISTSDDALSHHRVIGIDLVLSNHACGPKTNYAGAGCVSAGGKKAVQSAQPLEEGY